jgi:transposase
VRALGACTELNAVYRRLLKMTLEELQLLEQQVGQLDQEMASLLSPHQDSVKRLAETPGLGVDSAQQIIAEVGATAATFPSTQQLSSWVGACPGDEESGGVSKSHRSPKGNRHMRRILNQSANAAVKVKGSIFEIVYRRLVPRLGHKVTIGANISTHFAQRAYAPVDAADKVSCRPDFAVAIYPGHAGKHDERI